MLPERTSILVVGAGPTGLAAAISLFHHGFNDIVIVDAVERTTSTSRAIVIHAATLEALESVGCIHKFLELGIKGHSMNVWNRTSCFFNLDLSILSQYTKYPYTLLLPQHKTENILEEHLKGLGINVLRPYNAIGIRGDVDELGNTEVLFESGEVIKAQYVIGADGSRSVIRQLSGIGFADPDGHSVDDSLAQMVLADVAFSRDQNILPKDKIVVSVSGGSYFLFVPLQKSDNLQDTLYRVGFNVPTALGPSPSNPPLSYLQEHFDARGPLDLSSVASSPVSITKVLWSTRFRTHAAIADKFVFNLRDTDRAATDDNISGYVILIGDAAHIHSPLGGQGMNLGIRDAIELAPALIAHMNHKAELGMPGTGPLQAYGEARRKSALAVIRLTKRMMAVINALGTNWMAIIFYWLVRLLGSVPIVKEMIAWQVSGLGNR